MSDIQDRLLANALHRRRQDVSDDDIAASLDGDRTTVSRVFSDQYGVKLSRLGDFLAAMGYRAIPVATHIREVPESDYQSLLRMASIGAESLQSSDRHVRYSRPGGNPAAAVDTREPES